MKKIVDSYVLLAVFAFLAVATAKADTVVWYDFDGLGEAGTSVSHGTTIQNKASPGTLEATVIGIHNGESAKTEDTAHMPASAVGYPVGQRISDPVSGAMATSADGAIKFTSPASSGDYPSNDGGALQVSETSSELSSGTFTLELTIRLDPEDGFVDVDQAFVSKSVSASDNTLAWELQWLNHTLCFSYYEADGTERRLWGFGITADGEWHHVAIVINPAWGTWSVRKFVDYTALDGYGTYDTGKGLRTGTGHITIGARLYDAAAKFNSLARGVNIGEFRYSNVKLEIAQFLKARNVPLGPTISHVKFDDGTPNAATEYGTLCNGAFWASNSDSSVKPTYSSDVPGVRILDGEDGAVLSKHNDKSISFPGNSHYPACALWGRSVNTGVPANLLETYFVPMTADGVARMSGTIEFWMKPTPGQQVAWSSQPALLSDYRNDKSQNIWQFIFVNNSGKSADPVTMFNFYVTMCTNNTGDVVWKGLTVCPSDDVLDGKWHHVAAVFQPSGTNPGKTDVVTYVDHTERGKTSFDGVIDYRLGAYTLQMGMRYEGLIDEFRISDRALTPNQFLRAEKAPGFSIFVR